MFCDNVQIWLLLMVIATSGATPLKGLPFNLPDSKYCTSCELDTAKVYHPTVTLDKACLGYQMNIHSPHETVDGSMYKLLEDLRNIRSPASFVVHAYIQTMRAYQWVYDEPYDVIVMCVPTLEDSSCIKIFKSGQGFSRPPPLSVFQQSKINSIYNTGRNWEARFVLGIEDLWVSSVCNVEQHQRSYFSALDRVLRTWESSKYWKIQKYLQQKDAYDPKINIDFFRPCGDNSTIPRSISDGIQRCKGQIECSLQPSQPGSSQGQEIPKQSPASKSSKKSDVALGQPDPKKPSVEEQQQTFIINEFNPSKPSRNTQEEFIEIRVHPAPGNNKKSLKNNVHLSPCPMKSKK